MIKSYQLKCWACKELSNYFFTEGDLLNRTHIYCLACEEISNTEDLSENIPDVIPKKGAS